MSLEFIDTLHATLLCDKWSVGIQEYIDEKGKSIFNVCIDFWESPQITQTIDIYESYSEEKATKYYLKLIKDIKKTNGKK